MSLKNFSRQFFIAQVFLILIFFSKICFAIPQSCWFEENDDAGILPFDNNRHYVPEKGKAFFEILESRGCDKNNFQLGNYGGWRDVEMITFIDYFEGMPGLLGSFLGVCFKTEYHHTNKPTDYTCYINVK